MFRSTNWTSMRIVNDLKMSKEKNKYIFTNSIKFFFYYNLLEFRQIFFIRRRQVKIEIKYLNFPYKIPGVVYFIFSRGYSGIIDEYNINCKICTQSCVLYFALKNLLDFFLLLRMINSKICSIWMSYCDTLCSWV